MTTLPFPPTDTRPPLHHFPSQYVPGAKPAIPRYVPPVAPAPRSAVAPATPQPAASRPVIVPLPSDWHPNLTRPGRNVTAWGVVLLLTAAALAVARFVAIPEKVKLAIGVGGMALVAFAAISLLILGGKIVRGAKRISGE